MAAASTHSASKLSLTAPLCIVYALTFADGDVVEAESKATFREGRLYHVEPSDPVQYNKFYTDHVEAADASPIATGQ